MSLFRMVSNSFWTDSKVVDDFTPEDRYFYLYLMTNPHTNLCGCYELSIKQASDELGYTKEVVEKLINRFINIHKVIDYSCETKEILLINWAKNNWNTSEKYMKGVKKGFALIKCTHFRDYLTQLSESKDTLSIPYIYPMDSVSIPYGYPMDTAISIANTITNTVKPISHLKNNSNIKHISHNTIEPEATIEQDGECENVDSSAARQDSIVNIQETEKKVYFCADKELNEAFAEYLSMRKAIGKKVVSSKLITEIQNDLKHLSNGDRDTAIKILRQSIKNSWSSLQPLAKNNKEGKSKESILEKWGLNDEQVGN